MATYLYLFKDDVVDSIVMDRWGTFIDGLIELGHFVGGGPLAVGGTRKGESASNNVTEVLAGYMVVKAENLEQAMSLLDQCPTIVAGGSVEVRLVPEV